MFKYVSCTWSKNNSYCIYDISLLDTKFISTNRNVKMKHKILYLLINVINHQGNIHCSLSSIGQKINTVLSRNKVFFSYTRRNNLHTYICTITYKCINKNAYVPTYTVWLRCNFCLQPLYDYCTSECEYRMTQNFGGIKLW